MPRPTAAQLAYGSCTVLFSTLAMLLLSQTSSGLGVVVIAFSALVLGILVAMTVPAPKSDGAAAPSSAAPSASASAPSSTPRSSATVAEQHAPERRVAEQHISEQHISEQRVPGRRETVAASGASGAPEPARERA